MAAVISKELWMGNRIALANVKLVIGAGAPADTDVLVTDYKRYPIGTDYIDSTAGIAYKRVKLTPDADDYVALNEVL